MAILHAPTNTDTSFECAAEFGGDVMHGASLPTRRLLKTIFESSSRAQRPREALRVLRALGGETNSLLPSARSQATIGMLSHPAFRWRCPHRRHRRTLVEAHRAQASALTGACEVLPI